MWKQSFSLKKKKTQRNKVQFILPLAKSQQYPNLGVVTEFLVKTKGDDLSQSDTLILRVPSLSKAQMTTEICSATFFFVAFYMMT